MTNFSLTGSLFSGSYLRVFTVCENEIKHPIFSMLGMEKINFSGGEPFIHKRGDFVGELTRYCKEDLGLESVSIVCNGSLVTERWFYKYGN